MACSCGKRASRSNVIYVHTDPTGRQRSYATEIECKAAKLRSGGSCRVEEKK